MKVWLVICAAALLLPQVGAPASQQGEGARQRATVLNLPIAQVTCSRCDSVPAIILTRIDMEQVTVGDSAIYGFVIGYRAHTSDEIDFGGRSFLSIADSIKVEGRGYSSVKDQGMVSEVAVFPMRLRDLRMMIQTNRITLQVHGYVRDMRCLLGPNELGRIKWFLARYASRSTSTPQ